MSLRDLIVAQIREDGPMSVAEYMRLCLLHPRFGYYVAQMPFGAEGDFTTAPEISQMFGEMVGLCLAQSWLDQGAPARFTLAELGPGRGTLMADILRVTRSVPGFGNAAQVILVEASARLRDVQRSVVGEVEWVGDVAELPEQPMFLVANEFFDALPVRQFLRDGDHWRERQVGLSGDALVFGLAPPAPQDALVGRLADTKDGDLVEYCTDAGRVMGDLASQIETFGGAALIIDYGDWRSLGDTVQAVAKHAATDPLSDPGHADLTAHVDFEALGRAAAPCLHSKITPQGVFLERLGITARANALAQTLSGAALDNHVAAHRRLTHPEEMGNLFKVMGLVPKGRPLPPGLEK